LIYREFTRATDIGPYLPFTTKLVPLVLTKGLELLVTVRDGVAATVVAKRVLKNKDTQGRKFMAALMHTSDDLVEGEGEKWEIVPLDYM